MYFAIAPTGERVPPHKTPWGFCPGCGQYVTAKCGEITAPHFAHEGGVERGFSEPEFGAISQVFVTAFG
jgi:hypothetical protein